MSAIERYLPELEDLLHASVPVHGEAELLYTMMRYHLGWLDAEGRPAHAPAGKRIRPLLCLLACEGHGGDYRTALPAAAAVELLHNFTLIHDDVQDGSAERRHRATVWKLWGAPQAINAGDAMYALTRLTLLRMSDSGLPAERVLDAAQVLDSACLRICEGQCLDVDFEHRLSVDRQAYMAMVERKTAALIGCALELGALAAGASAQDQFAMRELGIAIGLAYQVQDDVLGIWGDPKVTGKPAADDVRSRKKTLPIIFAAEQGGSAVRARLEGIFASEDITEPKVAEVLEILEAVGARRAAEEEAARLFSLTEQLLSQCTLRDAERATLQTLIHSLLGRSS